MANFFEMTKKMKWIGQKISQNKIWQKIWAILDKWPKCLSEKSQQGHLMCMKQFCQEF